MRATHSRRGTSRPDATWRCGSATPSRCSPPFPYAALASFAGVGYHLDLAELRPGDRVLDLGSGSGTDAFCAGVSVGPTGRVLGVDFTDAQVANATRLGERHGIDNVRFVEASIDALPFDDASFDVVISNGVINLSPVKDRVFAEAARVLRPGGRLAIADIVSGTPLREATRRNTELWAACIAGAIPSTAYVDELEAAGFAITATRPNDYRFITERALRACRTYGVESLSIAATRRAASDAPETRRRPDDDRRRRMYLNPEQHHRYALDRQQRLRAEAAAHRLADREPARTRIARFLRLAADCPEARRPRPARSARRSPSAASSNTSPHERTHPMNGMTLPAESFWSAPSPPRCSASRRTWRRPPTRRAWRREH